ncbi:MAG: hypothetical protein HY553_16110 [Elusimicrobia bacterium]|nr:hypothetical protein [Elusimicrobiota bacterium]
MSEKASDLYKAAIQQLQAVSADFGVGDAARAAANAEIATLRKRVQEAALDDIAARTANLQALSTRLSGLLQKAQGGNVSGLQALAKRVKTAIGV